MKDQAILNIIKKRIRNSKCAVMLDIDETLLNPISLYQKRINDELGLKITVTQIEESGGLDFLSKNRPVYSKLKEVATKLRCDENFNSDLPIIEGSQKGINDLLSIQNLAIGGYLTTRPSIVTPVTENDLLHKGFPEAPVYARPEHILRLSTAVWKLSVLEEILKSYDGILIIIDDNISVIEKIYERNLNNCDNFIATILFNGPLTYTEVNKRKLNTDKKNHFYLANWKEIPSICSFYANNL